MGSKVAKHVDAERVEKEICEEPIVIYTKPNCSYCQQAKELLSVERLKFKEHDLDSGKADSANSNQAYINGLVYKTRQTTVPQIFLCGKFIGGFTELNELKHKATLRELLEECRDWN